MKTIQFTQQGLEQVKQDQQAILAKRKAAILELQKACEMGDLSENGYYKAAKAHLGELNRKFRQNTRLIRLAKVNTNINPSSSSINIGSLVTLSKDEQKLKYLLVGEYETNPVKGKISCLSPLGKALINKTIGDQIALQTPSSEVIYFILEVDNSNN